MWPGTPRDRRLVRAYCRGSDIGGEAGGVWAAGSGRTGTAALCHYAPVLAPAFPLLGGRRWSTRRGSAGHGAGGGAGHPAGGSSVVAMAGPGSTPPAMTARTHRYPLGAAVTLAELRDDPHPALARLRAAEPVSWVPVLNGWLVTRRDLAVAVMRDSVTFTVDD